MNYDYHIIVIGAGSGGLVVASGAAGLGAKVALIEGDKMGGDCLNAGCVPSKTFLKSAHLADAIDRGKMFGLEVPSPVVHMDQLMGRVADVIKSIEPHDSKERYEGLGVTVIEGYGSFVDAHTVDVGGKRLTAKTVVISTGSNPFVPPIKGLDSVPYYTNKNIFQLKSLPKHLIVLGAGPIGSELGQGFKHLGSEVTMIDKSPGIFGRDDEEVGPLMLQQFFLDGITMELGATVVEVRGSEGQIEVDIKREDRICTIKGDSLLVALGRKPNTEGLGLDQVGIKTGPRGHVMTNDRLQTVVPNIYACGDVTGPYAFTHMAGYQAGIVIQNAIFPVKKKVDYRAIPWVTYTKPEVAHVGLTEKQAKEKVPGYKKYIVNMEANDRAKAEGDVDGFLKILVDKKGIIIGTTMVGEKAGEQIGLANLAVVKRLKISAFMSMIMPYPTELDIYKTVGLQALKESFKPWQKNLVKKLFLK